MINIYRIGYTISPNSSDARFVEEAVRPTELVAIRSTEEEAEAYVQEQGYGETFTFTDTGTSS